MGIPRGRTIRLTPVRRLMVDMLRASQRVPLVAIERTMHLTNVIAARRGVSSRPSWFAIFLKAFAIVSDRYPELRRTYLTWPWAHIHQHSCNIAALAVARRVGEEEGVLMSLLQYPEKLPLSEIDAHIRAVRTAPIESVSDFRRQLKISRWPGLLRRVAWWLALDVCGDWRAKHAGTFGITGIGALGSAPLHVLSPLTTTITTGVFDPDGRIVVRLFFDHRVLDGVLPAKAMEHLEDALRGPIREELLAETTPEQKVA